MLPTRRRRVRGAWITGDVLVTSRDLANQACPKKSTYARLTWRPADTTRQKRAFIGADTLPNQVVSSSLVSAFMYVSRSN